MEDVKLKGVYPEEIKSTYHVTAFVEKEEVSFSCTCERGIAVRFVTVLMSNPAITSVVFDEVTFDECD